MKGKSGVRLESETNGVLEFETSWKRSFSSLKSQVLEAVEMTKTMNAAKDTGKGRKLFPFAVPNLRRKTPEEAKQGFFNQRPGKEGARERFLQPKEQLEIEIKDSTWNAGIQSSESFELNQFESFLKQHEWPEFVAQSIANANELIKTFNTEKTPINELVNLKNFLEIIINYILRGQGESGARKFW